MTNPVNSSPYLRNSRSFPDEILQLATETDKSYVEVARSVNDRTIGLYPTGRPSITGNKYYFRSQSQQSLRQMYPVTGITDIPLGFKLSSVNSVVQMYGTYAIANGDTYGFIPGAPNAIAGQIIFYIFVDTSSSITDLIRFVSGAGAPTIVSGTVIVEWVSKV